MANKDESDNSEPFNAEVFLRDVPLYDECSVSEAHAEVFKLHNGFNFDGHCPQCGKHATFSVPSSGNAPQLARIDVSDITTGPYFRKFQAVCTRDNKHVQDFFVRGNKATFTKVGQFPSLADIVIDENRKYRALLEPQDSQEFYKAIGLAAHGVGIGSFVYLRRIFQRLVDGRFKKHAEEEGWDEGDYQKKRMNERVSFLKDYLPKFLVENSAVYSVLSVGIHELDESTCLAFFPVLKNSIGMILEEDWVAREDEKRREEARKALALFNTPAPGKK